MHNKILCELKNKLLICSYHVFHQGQVVRKMIGVKPGLFTMTVHMICGSKPRNTANWALKNSAQATKIKSLVLPGILNISFVP